MLQRQQLRFLASLAVAVFMAAAPVHAKNRPDTYDLHLDITLRSDREILEPLLKAASRLYEKKDEAVVSLARLEGRLAADLDSFRRVLRSEGYYAAALDQRVVRDGNRLAVEIVVNPGPRYLVRQLTVEHGLDDAPAASLPLQPGQPARSEAIVAAEHALLGAFNNAGYPFALEGERTVTVDHATQRVDIVYRVAPGAKARFGAVRFEGLSHAEPDYLERFVPWTEGALFSQKSLDEFRQRLAASGLFRTVVAFPGTPEGEAVPLFVQVEESKRRVIELGAGYSTGQGFEAEASWTNRNMWGRGEHVKAAAVFGEAEQSLRADLRKSHFRRYDQTLTATTRLGRENLPAYTSHLAEVGAGIERRLARRLVGSVGLQLKLTEIRDSGTRDSFLLFGAPVSVAWDSTHNILDPKSGERASLRVKPAISAFDGQFTYVTSELNASAYRSPFGSDWVTFAARARLGNIWGASLDRLPLSERLFAGGGGSVRGYGYQALGPKDADGDPTGGRSVAEVAFEARLRVSETIGIVPFIDGGNIYEDRLPGFTNFRWGAGLGVRYYTSVAPVRLDVALPLNRREGDASFTLYISLGQSF